MAVQVEDKWRFKKVRSEAASRSAFAFKINKQIKEKKESKASYGHKVRVNYSREIIVKMTGGAKNKRGIKGAVEYISKDWQEELIDSNGIKYKTKEEMESAVKILQENVAASVKVDPTKEVKVTHNIVFSAPEIAGVRREDALDAVKKVLEEKYPNNYFVMAYHDEIKNPHVHVILNIHKDTGKRIDIKNKDFHEIRRSFGNNLIELGYDVKASRKYENEEYDFKAKEYKKLLSRENKNIYEVVDFGTASYQLDKRNSKSNYLIYRTLNKGEEVTIWGKEILEEVIRNNIKINDLVKIKKEGEVEIKVPVYGKDGKTVELWKNVKRNQWSIEKIADNSIKLERKLLKGIELDTFQQAAKQLAERQRFEHEKKLYLSPLYKEKYQLEQKMQYKEKYTHKI